MFFKVKLGETGWKERYYEEKFSAKTPEERDAVRRDVVSCSDMILLFERNFVNE